LSVRVELEEFCGVFPELLDNRIDHVLGLLRRVILRPVAAVRVLAVMRESIEATVTVGFPRDWLEAQDRSTEAYAHLFLERITVSATASASILGQMTFST